MDMRTPLKKVRGLGSSKQGTEHFWVQRLTAVALIPLFLFFIIFVIANAGASYEQVVGSLANPFVAVLMGLMVIAGLIHMRIGMQEIIAFEACRFDGQYIFCSPDRRALSVRHPEDCVCGVTSKWHLHLPNRTARPTNTLTTPMM